MCSRYKLIGRHVEFPLRDAIGPNDAGHVYRAVFAQTEVNDGGVDRLFLQKRTGAHLDLAANGVRVDAVIARLWVGQRPERLPAVRLFALVQGPHRPPLGRQTQEIESSVAIQVASGRNPHGDRAGQGRELAVFVRQENVCLTRAGHHQIERPVVIQVLSE